MKKTATRSWSRVYYAWMVATLVTFILIPARLPAQTARIMKMFVIFLLAATFSAYGHGSAQTITLSGRHLDLKQVFSVIEQQTGYVVFYRQDQLTHTKPLSLQVYNMPLKAFLDTVLSQQQLDSGSGTRPSSSCRKPLLHRKRRYGKYCRQDPPRSISL